MSHRTTRDPTTEHLDNMRNSPHPVRVRVQVCTTDRAHFLFVLSLAVVLAVKVNRSTVGTVVLRDCCDVAGPRCAPEASVAPLVWLDGDACPSAIAHGLGGRTLSVHATEVVLECIPDTQNATRHNHSTTSRFCFSRYVILNTSYPIVHYMYICIFTFNLTTLHYLPCCLSNMWPEICGFLSIPKEMLR